MKRIWQIAVGVLTLLAAAFFSVGGMQIVRAVWRRVLPAAHKSASPANDLAILRAAVLANEHGATPQQFARFTQIVDQATTPQTTDELTLLVSRALAVFDNAHTTVLSPLMRRLPIRLHWTADALIVVKARPDYAPLIGRRILAFGGKTPEEMLTAMPQLVGGGTPGWVRYRSEYFYSAPTALDFFGAVVRNAAVELRTVDAGGAKETVTLVADANPLPGDPFWDFRNAFPGDTHFLTNGWVTLLRSEQDLPLYLQESDKLFLLRDLPETRAVYIRMNGSINSEDETVKHFIQRVLAQVRHSAPTNLIVDFRYNRGGDFSMVMPLVRGLSQAVPQNGRLYLITGPNTFSAGLIAASQFKRYIPDRLVVVGEDVGDRLRFRGEGLIVTLPATRIDVYLGTAWDDVASDCGWFDDCWPLNKFLLRGVGVLVPDIRIANTWASYRYGHDLVLNSVWMAIARR